MSPESGPRGGKPNAVAVVLLGMMALLAGGSVRRESVTVDEVAHVGAGVSYLQALDLRMNEEHPPLAKVLAAIPLVLRGAHADYSHPSWSFSQGFFKQFLGEWVFGHWLLTRWNDPVSTLFWARMPMLLLTVALGFVLYRYGAKVGSPMGGLLCLCSYATMPAFLTFGPLVLTDVAVTFFSVLTLRAFADLWRFPTREAVVKFGLALGGALLSKFSAGLLFLCFMAVVLSLRLRRAPQQPTEKNELRAWRRQRWRSLILGVLLAAFVVYTVYFVLSWNQPTDSFASLPHAPVSPLVRRLLMPPWLYFRGLAGFAMSASRPTYILGKAYPHGVWFYFPVVFFLKSPLAFLALLLLALVAALAARSELTTSGTVIPRSLVLHWRTLWISLAVFSAACMLSRLTISIRHFSMPLVLLILMLAPLPTMLHSLRRSGWRLARAGSWLTLALTLWSVVTAMRAYPYYLPFLNSLSMGRPGYELVNDSNLDWNQALPDVEQWVQRRGLQRILLDQYGISDPIVYVPQAQFWNCQDPSAADAGAWAVVSASMIADGHNCRWLLQYPHESFAGGSMYSFQLPTVIPSAGSAGGPPLSAFWHNFGGVPWPEDIRLVTLNCIRDPGQLQPTMDRMMARYQAAAREKKK
jgi:4-amino-4-deoxy-L-arabinose transferase-like glycosyltransferase